MERAARKSRDELVATGHTLPPVCGYQYMPKPRKGQPTPTLTVCYRVAGANTSHPGKSYCDYHEALANNDIDNIKAPKQLQAAKQHAYEQAKFFGQPTNIDPHTAILSEISRTASVIQWLEDRMLEERDQGVHDKEIMQSYSVKNGFQSSVWMDLFQSERKHLVATCVAAIKAGIAERKVQIAEQQGRLIAGMMMAFIHDPELGLTPDQVLRSPLIIRKHLLALPSETSEGIDPARVLEAHVRDS
jgi:hypothetical protein